VEDNQPETLIKFIKVVLPSILLKTVYEKAFISKEAKNSMTNAISNCKTFEVLQIILDEGCRCKNNNKTLIEGSYTYVGEFFKHAKPEFILQPFENESEWKKLMVDTINQLYEGVESMPRIKKVSTEALKELKKKVDEGSTITFDTLLN